MPPSPPHTSASKIPILIKTITDTSSKVGLYLVCSMQLLLVEHPVSDLCPTRLYKCNTPTRLLTHRQYSQMLRRKRETLGSCGSYLHFQRLDRPPLYNINDPNTVFIQKLNSLGIRQPVFSYFRALFLEHPGLLNSILRFLGTSSTSGRPYSVDLSQVTQPLKKKIATISIRVSHSHLAFTVT